MTSILLLENLPYYVNGNVTHTWNKTLHINNYVCVLTSGCHGYMLVGVTSKFSNLAKVTLLVSMESGSRDNSDKF